MQNRFLISGESVSVSTHVCCIKAVSAKHVMSFLCILDTRSTERPVLCARASAAVNAWNPFNAYKHSRSMSSPIHSVASHPIDGNVKPSNICWCSNTHLSERSIPQCSQSSYFSKYTKYNPRHSGGTRCIPLSLHLRAYFGSDICFPFFLFELPSKRTGSVANVDTRLQKQVLEEEGRVGRGGRRYCSNRVQMNQVRTCDEEVNR